jgi:glycerol uptake facilitator protein
MSATADPAPLGQKRGAAMAAVRRKTGWRGTVWGEFVSEFLGIFVLISFGDGVVAMTVAALNQSGRGTFNLLSAGDWLLIAWGWALAVTFGVYVAGGVSGAHINPAVTLALAVRRGFPWVKVPIYIVAQVIGAFTGAALVYLIYHNAINSFEVAKHITRGALGGPNDSTPTFSIFATFPAPYFHGYWVGPFLDQVVGTGFLLMFVLALTDIQNQAPRGNLTPWIIGLAVAAIGMSFGANAGYAINPARDFGPRFYTWLAGWGRVAIPGVSNYMWIPIVGPFAGGVLGAIIYDLFIKETLIRRAELGEPEEVGRVVREEGETRRPPPDDMDR